MSIRRFGAIAMAVASTLVIAACGSSGSSSSASSAGTSASSGTTGGSKTLVGAGSTLIAPLMSQWQPTYNTASGVAVTYGAIGSGGGIEQITARTVDFGASDAPMTASQFTACKGCVQLPWALTATDVAYNVKGVPNQLKLTGPVLAGIYLGQITTWNASQIKALNPGVNLPATKITPVYRSDGSGDTFAFTNYLSEISPTFKSKVGNATQVAFPTGIGGKGNSGVAGVLSTTNGAIAYIGIAYVLANKFDYALVQNAAGKYPVPGIPSISAAAAAVPTTPTGTNAIVIVNPPASASGAYPISTYSYAILPTSSSKATQLKDFVTWAITTGQADGPKLDFAPLPAQIVSGVKTALTKVS